MADQQFDMSTLPKDAYDMSTLPQDAYEKVASEVPKPEVPKRDAIAFLMNPSGGKGRPVSFSGKGKDSSSLDEALAMGANFGKDIWSVIKGTYQTLRHPIDTVTGLADLVQGGADYASRQLGSSKLQRFSPTPTPQEAAFGELYRGAKEKAKKVIADPIQEGLSTIYEHPFFATEAGLGALGAPTLTGLAAKGAKTALVPKGFEDYLGRATNRFKSVVPGFKTSKNPDMAKNADMIMRDLVRQNDAGLLTTMDDTGQSVPGLPTQFKNKKMGLNYPVDDRNYMADMMDTIQQGQANTAKEMMDVLQRATGKGVTITDNAVADGLQKVLDDLGPGGRERGRTGFAKLLEDRIQELRTEGKTWTPEQMQQWAAGINAKAKNVTVGSIETNNQMALAGAEARAVKRALESVVDGVKDGSGELGQLKRRYAAYKSFEDDLRSRLGKSVQQENAINGVDLFDMYSATRMLAGITGGHPAAIPQALAVQAMKGINKTAKNISTNMYRTFLDLEKASKKYTPIPKPPTSAQYAPVTPMQNMKSQVLNERRQGILEGLRDYRGPNNLVE